ncbi:type II toxin-antitoxin system mRNA interferase toxin, RelE/StbE family [Methylotenera sp.]|uniref:type II toxin-antitoxin system mRNA interferase toxin, RelE/StbE family n=1 Tax=Methylotenera sp. TaxID=2051956 RepID=UPI0024892DB3|nr:type II toxin-antitoxin system mRNA interferase toxin, RelE/StbE family [Methylotenera sp.]MDI1299779.1 type II toxin-antitoxin system mRNA interferase toxin, RelE/StbE family [Methylotenera sp.]
MIVKQTNSFKRKVKKLNKTEKLALDEAVKSVMNDPSIGEMKIGDLAGVQVYKYKLKAQLYLLAYMYDGELILTFIEYGTHENFYRDLKSKPNVTKH